MRGARTGCQSEHGGGSTFKHLGTGKPVRIKREVHHWHLLSTRPIMGTILIVVGLTLQNGALEAAGITPPTILPEPIPLSTTLNLKPALLPAAAKAFYPAFDGDSFFVSLKPKVAGEFTSEQVFTDVVAPVLQAMGFQRELSEIVTRTKKGAKPRPASLSDLADVTCMEVDEDKYKRFHAVCDAMRKGAASPEAERVFQLGDGMSFAQFKADIERQLVEYYFLQVVKGVAIDQVGIVARLWEGETVTVVHGVVLNQFRITNKQSLTPESAVDRGIEVLLRLPGVQAPVTTPKDLRLVLLPYGRGRTSSGSLVPGLRFAYRTLLTAHFVPDAASKPERVTWLAWVDADTGQLLQLLPQVEQVSAIGNIWRRDAGTGTHAARFEVDPSSSGTYTLELNDDIDGVFNRLDRFEDGAFDDQEVAVSADARGSTISLANFDQAPLNNAPRAVCSDGGNAAFRQINVFAHLHRFWRLVVAAGSFPTFPEAPINVSVDVGNPYSFADYDTSRLRFATYPGFTHQACPDAPNLGLNDGQDATIIAHEFAHLAARRLQYRRPADWCGPSCDITVSNVADVYFHDFADAWANGYASSPCVGGWSWKNQGQSENSRNCVNFHDEGSGMPRLASLPEDRFPEHRLRAMGDYADGQIAAGALWLARQGMRSKCLPSGTAQFWVRLNRALWQFWPTGLGTCRQFVDSQPTTCDKDLYRFLQDFMLQMTWQWANAGQPGGPPGFRHNGAHTTNKLLSAWARAGMFLVPEECIDGDPTTGDPATDNANFCPVTSGGENGGDAVIDVNDNDESDDVTIDGIIHPEVDYLRREDGVAPTFQVWTGPRYVFDPQGWALNYVPSSANPAPCNVKFTVELASNEAFTQNVVTSGWRTVSTTVAPECFGVWTPGDNEWHQLRGVNGDTKVYYRVRTRAADDTNERLSTSPGNGRFTVPAAYIVVNDSGRP